MDKKQNIFIDSFNELKKLNTLTITAMFAALSIILGYYSINIAGVARIGFSALPATFSAYLFGPVVGAIFGASVDVIKHFMKPEGTFYIFFTLNAVLAGIIRGSILYKKDLSIVRIIISELIITILCNLILNTYFISILHGKAFLALLPIRIIKNLISLPTNIILFYFMAKLFIPIKNKILK